MTHSTEPHLSWCLDPLLCASSKLAQRDKNPKTFENQGRPGGEHGQVNNWNVPTLHLCHAILSNHLLTFLWHDLRHEATVSSTLGVLLTSCVFHVSDVSDVSMCLSLAFVVLFCVFLKCLWYESQERVIEDQQLASSSKEATTITTCKNAEPGLLDRWENHINDKDAHWKERQCDQWVVLLSWLKTAHRC